MAKSTAPPMLVGGAAVEFWTGGTGMRPTLNEIDIVLPVQRNGTSVSAPMDRSVQADPYATRFHSYAESLINDVIGDSEAAFTFDMNSISGRLKGSSLSLDLLSPAVTGSFTFQTGLSDFAVLRTNGMSEAVLTTLIAAPLTLVIGKITQPRIRTAIDPDNARPGDEDKGIRDVIDVLALLQTQNPSVEKRWLGVGLRNAYKYAAASGVPRRPAGTPGPFEALGELLTEPRLIDNVRSYADKHPEIAIPITLDTFDRAVKRSYELDALHSERLSCLRAADLTIKLSISEYL